ncbi:hypothetical protein M885DRAFT_616758 [Pelagophyceae sp. CCMP2097]|nr:hypothetical protein M885DRAFT_616758 [Pelagophyceae sp. CCMP2097]
MPAARLLCALCLLAPASGLAVQRRVALERGVALVGGAFGASNAPAYAEEGQLMRTSNDAPNFKTSSVGAGTMSGSARPVTNVIMIEPPSSEGTTVSAGLVLSGGVLATVRFDAPALKLSKGMYYDIEARDKLGDSAYIHVAPQPGAELAQVPAAFITDTILARAGRYGAFGSPTDVRVVSDETDAKGLRLLEVSFAAVTPGGADAPRRAVVAATTALGSPDLVLLVASSSQQRWTAGGRDVLRSTAETFRVESSRPTKLSPRPSSDYRFESQGGMRAAAERLLAPNAKEDRD